MGKPFRTKNGWAWWPWPRHLGILYKDRFSRDIFSVRYGYAKVWDIGPFSIRWAPPSGGTGE